MHCGVMVTGYNQGDWERLLAEDYSRPPTIADAANMDETLELGELVEPLGFDSLWATEHYGSAERFTFDGKIYKIPPTTIRPQARHKGELTKRIKAAFTTEASARR